VRAIRTLVRYLGIGDGNMEEGSLRCDANVSLRPRGATALGTKTEIKNMNSFKNVRDAIEHEVKRQAPCSTAAARRAGDAPVGRGARRDAVDALEGAGARLPLLPRARPAARRGRRRDAGGAGKSLPELPEDRFARYSGPDGLSPQDAGVLVSEREIAAYFDAAVAAGAPAKRAANWVINEVLAVVGDARRLGDADLPCPRPRWPAW
jgi:aspartyl-tRNA(Asn)/glutamyl-tRNA(Gln) amidotransferase subunit B